jgi:hypothetical protein
VKDGVQHIGIRRGSVELRPTLFHLSDEHVDEVVGNLKGGVLRPNTSVSAPR